MTPSFFPSAIRRAILENASSRLPPGFLTKTLIIPSETCPNTFYHVFQDLSKPHDPVSPPWSVAIVDTANQGNPTRITRTFASQRAAVQYVTSIKGGLSTSNNVKHKGVLPYDRVIPSPAVWMPHPVLSAFIEEAKKGVTFAETESFLKLLAIVVLKTRDEKVKPLLPKIEKIRKTALRFGEAFGVFNSKFLDKLLSELFIPSKREENVKVLRDKLAKAFKLDIKHDHESVTREHMAIMQAILTLLAKPDSSSAYDRLSRFIVELRDRDLSSYFVKSNEKTGGDHSTIMDKIRSFMGKVGKAGTRLSGDDKNKLDKSKVKEYNDLYKSLRERMSHDIRALVLESGKNALPVLKIVEKLKAKGYDTVPFHPTIAKSSSVYVDERGFLCDAQGNATNIKNVNPDFTVNINKKYSTDPDLRSTWLLSYTNPTSNVTNRVYTTIVKAGRAASRFSAIEDTLDPKQIDALKKKWRAILNAPSNANYVYSLLAEAIYWTAARIGSGEGKTGDTRTFGLSSIKASHVKKLGQGVRLRYLGKKAVEQVHDLTPDMAKDAADKKALLILITFLKKKMEGNKDAYVFADKSGERARSLLLNRYLSSIGSKVTAHKFRHIRGTELSKVALDAATQRVKKSGKITEKAVKQAFLEAMSEVGRKLGHISKDKVTPMTAIKYYVVPSVMANWFSQFNIRPIKQVEDAMRLAAKG